jgi:hypothetical protein
MILHDLITRLRAPLVSAGYGNEARDWAAAVPQEFRVHWSPGGTNARGSTESVGDEAQLVTRAKVFGDPGLDLKSTDRVVGPDGETYEVDGDVMRSYRRGQPHHVRAFLRRISIPEA